MELSKGDAKARALMVLGFILGAEGRIDDADASFQEAGKLSNTTRGRAAALDGQAYIRIKANSTTEELEKAGQLLNDADKQDSSYDLARFHRA